MPHHQSELRHQSRLACELQRSGAKKGPSSGTGTGDISSEQVCIPDKSTVAVAFARDNPELAQLGKAVVVPGSAGAVALMDHRCKGVVAVDKLVRLDIAASSGSQADNNHRVPAWDAGCKVVEAAEPGQSCCWAVVN